MALEHGYKDHWLASAVKENNIKRVVQLLELGIHPTESYLVDNCLTAGNFEMAALLRKHGAPINTQVTQLLSYWKRWKSRGTTATRLALWNYVQCKKQSDLVTVRPLRKWVILSHWVRMRAIALYLQHVAAMPGSHIYEQAAKRFKAVTA